jgi:recombinational DNA repair protein (RecF pathway)
MIASGKKGAYLSRFTLALLDSSGWYPNVNYTYAEPTTWGKGKGCKFLNIDDCGGN